MAILMRGGSYDKFDPSKLRPREWAVVLENDPSAKDGKAIYICFAAGNVKRISTYEDMKDDLITATDDIREQYVQALEEIRDEVETMMNETAGFKAVSEAKAQDAASSAQTAAQKSELASASAESAESSASNSLSYSSLSKSYAIGTNGEARPGDSEDNSKHYKEECERLYQVIERLIASVSSGGLIPAGTITFEELPTEPQTNYMYNISNDFVTDDRFEDGAGRFYGIGANVYWTPNGKWDVLAGMSVIGVKGENDANYQTGYVTITKESLGLSEIGADIQNQIDDITNKITKMQKLVCIRKNASSLIPNKLVTGWLSDIIYNGNAQEIEEYGADYYELMGNSHQSGYIGSVTAALVEYDEAAGELKGSGIYRASYSISFSELYALNSKISLSSTDESDDNIMVVGTSMYLASGYYPAWEDVNQITEPKVKFLRSKPGASYIEMIRTFNVVESVYAHSDEFAGIRCGATFSGRLKPLSKVTDTKQLKVDLYVELHISNLDYITFGYEQSIS